VELTQVKAQIGLFGKLSPVPIHFCALAVLCLHGAPDSHTANVASMLSIVIVGNRSPVVLGLSI
jgi:hypothetical protein